MGTARLASKYQAEWKNTNTNTLSRRINRWRPCRRIGINISSRVETSLRDIDVWGLNRPGCQNRCNYVPTWDPDKYLANQFMDPKKINVWIFSILQCQHHWFWATGALGPVLIVGHKFLSKRNTLLFSLLLCWALNGSCAVPVLKRSYDRTKCKMQVGQSKIFATTSMHSMTMWKYASQNYHVKVCKPSMTMCG